MKRLLIPVLAVGMFGLAGTANAQSTEDIVNTKHNLSSSAPLGNTYSTLDTDRVCVFCHSPHTEVGAVEAPLWNRTLSTAVYTMYSSPTVDMTIATGPQGVSQACLSCHDGTVAFDSLVNAPGSGGFVTGGTSQIWNFGLVGNTMGAGVTRVGPDLSATHPISVTYNEALDAQFTPLATLQGLTGSVKLFGGTANQVECASCHNPHEATKATFLRVDNAASALCTTCHLK